MVTKGSGVVVGEAGQQRCLHYPDSDVSLPLLYTHNMTNGSCDHGKSPCEEKAECLRPELLPSVPSKVKCERRPVRRDYSY